MKRKITITEGELKNAISEAIGEKIEELTRHEKSRNEKNAVNVFKKGRGGYNNIKTFGILTAENPDSTEAPMGVNKKGMKSLSNELKSGHMGFVQQRGHFQGSDENSYFIFNVNVPLLSYYAGMFQQTSFIYGELADDGTVLSQYWEKNDPSAPYDKQSNPYVKKDETSSYVDLSGADDNYSIIGKRFKYVFPFSIFEGVDRKMEENMRLMYESRGTKRPSIDWIVNSVGYASYYNRGGIYKGICGSVNG